MANKNDVKLSIIVPVYNVEKYIDKCLDSLINQTLKDIEIIVVNDGTKDNSQTIIDKYVKNYPTKVFSYIKKNGGLSSARNYGIKKATGEYVTFVDSDDYVEKKLYEIMYKKAIEENSDIVCCPIKFTYLNYESFKSYNLDIFNKSILDSPKIMIQANSYAVNKIYKRFFWKKHNFVFPTQLYEDSALIYNVMLLANNISCINNYCYCYNRTNEDGITKIVDNRIYDIFKSTDSILDFYKQNNCYDLVKEVVDNQCIRHIAVRIEQMIKNHQFNFAYNYILYAHKYLNKRIPNWKKNKLFIGYNTKSKRKKMYRLLFKYKLLFKLSILYYKIKK